MSVADQARHIAAPSRRLFGNLTVQQSRTLWGWVFLSPWVIGFLVFYFAPMVASLVFTFTDLQLTKPDEVSFVGLANYRRLLTDPYVGKSLKVTLSFMLLAVPISIIVPLALATLLNSKKLWGRRLFRTLFYMPYMVPIISITYIWNGFLNVNSGWLNRFIENVLGLEGPNWLYSPTWIYPALLMIGIWGTGNAMLTLLASMQTVPTELYEAAKVDGANPITIFRHVTLPLITPMILYNLVLSLIGLFRYFDIPYIISRGTGGPNDITLFYNIYFYRQAFTYDRMGYGATLAWLLFVIALIVTGLVFASARRWVYYAGERE
ncbi:MAG: sugar ABC transporter permease [Chloroflexota bacterium]|jgi:multiple sugar transport system permease protein|nr:sugar ABC transporter permease [Anaerolineae bacterium]HMM27208.1 sugar ABC transporter permease [Aggregatilineaceae bacterium]